MENKIFTYDEIKDKAEIFRQAITAEYCYINISTLGGTDKPCLLLSISLDKKDTWINGIFQNSRYYHFSIDYNGEIENFSNGLKVKHIRKKMVKNLDEAIKYINTKLSEAKNV